MSFTKFLTKRLKSPADEGSRIISHSGLSSSSHGAPRRPCRRSLSPTIERAFSNTRCASVRSRAAFGVRVVCCALAWRSPAGKGHCTAGKRARPFRVANSVADKFVIGLEFGKGSAFHLMPPLKGYS